MHAQKIHPGRVTAAVSKGNCLQLVSAYSSFYQISLSETVMQMKTVNFNMEDYSSLDSFNSICASNRQIHSTLLNDVDCFMQ